MPIVADHVASLAVANRLYTVRVLSAETGSSTVEVSLDSAQPWTFSAATSGGISFGAAGDAAYLWSADTFVALPDSPSAGLEVFNPDEDLLVVFRVGDRWLLICETSLRVLSGLSEVQRLELRDVVVEVRWVANELLVRLFDETRHSFVLEGGCLRSESDLSVLD